MSQEGTGANVSCQGSKTWLCLVLPIAALSCEHGDSHADHPWYDALWPLRLCASLFGLESGVCSQQSGDFLT